MCGEGVYRGFMRYVRGIWGVVCSVCGQGCVSCLKECEVFEGCLKGVYEIWGVLQGV